MAVRALPAHLPVHEKIVQRAQEQEQAAHPQADAVQVALQQLLVLPGSDTHPAKRRAPGPEPMMVASEYQPKCMRTTPAGIPIR